MAGFVKSIEKSGRRLLLRFLARSRQPGLPKPRTPKTALVIRIDPRVGNIVMLTSFLEQLKTTYPTVDITVLGPQRAEALMYQHPMIKRFVPFDKKTMFGNASWFEVLTFLRNHTFDLVFEASNPSSGSTTHAILTSISRSPVKVGFERPNGQSLFDVVAPVLHPLDKHHENTQRSQLLRALGHPPSTTPLPNLRHLSTEGSSTIKQWLDQNVPTTFVVLNIGARLQNKHLSPQRYRQILSTVIERGHAVIVTYGPNERPLAERTAANTAAILGPETNLQELGFIFKRAS